MDTLTLAETAFVVASLTKPVTLHTIAAVVETGAAAVEKFSSKTPKDAVKAADIVDVDGLMLKQKVAAVVTLKAEKCKPAIDTSL